VFFPTSRTQDIALYVESVMSMTYNERDRPLRDKSEARGSAIVWDCASLKGLVVSRGLEIYEQGGRAEQRSPFEAISPPR
jgi:hypothetical protein